MESTLIDTGEEEVFLQQLEMLKQQKVAFPAESERLYAKLLWRKKMNDLGLPVFNLDQEIISSIKRTKKREQIVK